MNQKDYKEIAEIMRLSNVEVDYIKYKQQGLIFQSIVDSRIKRINELADYFERESGFLKPNSNKKYFNKEQFLRDAGVR